MVLPVPIPGIGQTASYLKSKIKLTLVFEVIDDPDESLEARAYTKAVNIYVVFSKQKNETVPEPKEFHSEKLKHVTYVPGVTKQTVLDARKIDFVDPDTDGAYMYVLVEPVDEWKGKYEPRVYSFQVKTPRIYNVAVSLKPKKEPEPDKTVRKPKGFIV